MARQIPRQNLLEPLIELGLSGSEAAAYAYLVRHSPATAYKVAKGIGKPVANTYKTIASLEEKGAVVVDDGESRLCRAVPPEEFLARLDRRFRDQRSRAAASLVELQRAARKVDGELDADAGVYRLHSRAQVMERARAMLARASRCALGDMFPDPLTELAADLDRAAARGIDVVVKPYTESPLKRAVAIPIIQFEREIPQLWPGHHVNLVTDAREALLALLDPQGDGVIQAIYTASPYLAAIQHSGLQFEMIATHVRDGIYREENAESLRAIVRSYIRFSLSQMPGYKALLTGGMGQSLK
jgi:sugar-specific transcriptional regulator TrmB